MGPIPVHETSSDTAYSSNDFDQATNDAFQRSLKKMIKSKDKTD